MAANTIDQLTTANTFQHWLLATQDLIGTANNLTNGNGTTFFANTRLEIGTSESGDSANASLNVQYGATISTLHANNITVSDNVNTSNVVTTEAYVTLLYGDANTAIYANIASASADATSAGSYANSAFHHANSAFGAANTNATAVTVLQGVDVSQNNSITSSFNHANAAFAFANTGGDALAFAIALG